MSCGWTKRCEEECGRDVHSNCLRHDVVKNMERENIDDYFLRITEVIGSRGTCDRGRSGCIIIKDKNILSTGYVGAPHGLPHCDDENHLFNKVYKEDGTSSEHCVRTTHSEANSICQSAKNGISINGATIYSTMFPCINCAKLIINSGIKRVVSEFDYQQSKESKEMFDKIGIEYKIMKNELKKY